MRKLTSESMLLEFRELSIAETSRNERGYPIPIKLAYMPLSFDLLPYANASMPNATARIIPSCIR